MLNGRVCLFIWIAITLTYKLYIYIFDFVARIDKVTSQNNELKKVIAKECSMSEIVDKQKKELEDEIASVKSNFFKEL